MGYILLVIIFINMIENLDPQDREIIEAIQNGKTDSEIATDFGVSEDKVVSLRGHLVNENDTVESPADSSEVEPTTTNEEVENTAGADVSDVEPVEPTEDTASNEVSPEDTGVVGTEAGVA